MKERGQRRGWQLGCGGLLLVALVIAGWTWNATRLSDPLDDLRVLDPVQAPANGTIAVRLELESGELILEPGAPGDPLSVEAHYDARDYRLEESADANGYRLRFLATSSKWIAGIKQGLHGGQPQLRVRLPVDTPMRLEVVQSTGAAVVDLGGLHLRSVDFDFRGALLKVDADRPLEGDLESFSVTGRRGGLLLESLSLMRPRKLDLDFRMGQVLLDLRGDWPSDASIDVSMSVTDATFRVPRGARVIGLDALPPRPPADDEVPGSTLRFNVETGTRTTLRVFE